MKIWVLNTFLIQLAELFSPHYNQLAIGLFAKLILNVFFHLSIFLYTKLFLLFVLNYIGISSFPLSPSMSSLSFLLTSLLLLCSVFLSHPPSRRYIQVYMCRTSGTLPVNVQDTVRYFPLEFIVLCATVDPS